MTFQQNITDLIQQRLKPNHDSLDARLTAVELALSVTPPPPGDPAFYKAIGSVDQTGTAEEIAGAAVLRNATGQYDITFNNPANSATYPVLATMQGLPQNDDYQWAYLNRTVNGFRLEVREQDNGGTAGVLRDSGFSFLVPII